MKRRRSAPLALLLAAALILSLSLTTTAVSEDAPVTIRFAWWGGDTRHQATIDAVETVFKPLHPNYTFEYEYAGYDGYHDKIFASLVAGNAPDLFQYNPENLVDICYPTELVLPAADFIEKGIINLDDIPQSAIADGVINGKQYAIIVNNETWVVYYNKTLFDQAGVPYPTEMWTWADFEEICKQLKEKLPEGVYPATDMSREADQMPMMFMHQQGGSYLSPDGQVTFEETIKPGLLLFDKFRQLGYVPTGDVTVGGSVSITLGNAAMDMGYNAGTMTIQGEMPDGMEIGILPYPDSQTLKLGAYTKGEHAFCIARNTQFPDETAVFLNEFVNNLDMGKILGLVRALPPNTKVREMLSENLSPLEKDIFWVQNLADQSNDTPEPRYIPGWNPVVMTIVQQEIQYYMFGQKTLDQAMSDAVYEAEILLEERK